MHPPALPPIDRIMSSFPLLYRIMSSFPLLYRTMSSFPLMDRMMSSFSLIHRIMSSFPLLNRLMFDCTDGPTETTIWSSSFTLCSTGTSGRSKSADSLTFTNGVPVIPIGTPISQVICTFLCCAVLCCAVLCCTVLYCTVLYCTVLYCTVLHCYALYCILNNATAQGVVIICTDALFINILFYLLSLISFQWFFLSILP